jgi:hypothetical protein
MAKAKNGVEDAVGILRAARKKAIIGDGWVIKQGGKTIRLQTIEGSKIRHICYATAVANEYDAYGLRHFRQNQANLDYIRLMNDHLPGILDELERLRAD